jgi:hypothetical protein
MHQALLGFKISDIGNPTLIFLRCSLRLWLRYWQPGFLVTICGGKFRSFAVNKPCPFIGLATCDLENANLVFQSFFIFEAP